MQEWLTHAGFKNIKHKYINLVPFFCPDWFARVADFVTPIVEKIPTLRKFACGQILIVAKKIKNVKAFQSRIREPSQIFDWRIGPRQVVPEHPE